VSDAEKVELRRAIGTAEERTQLESFLDFYRNTLLRKCEGLSDEQLKSHPVATSDLTLLGLIRHYAGVEQFWFEHIFANELSTWYYDAANDPDVDFHDLDGISVEEALNNFHSSIATSKRITLGHADDMVAALPHPMGYQVNLRWIYIHLIEEYARHAGHADLLRELIDGTVGY
jgi:hypothetical protein